MNQNDNPFFSTKQFPNETWAEFSTRIKRQQWNKTPLMQRTMRESGILDVPEDANDEQPF
jgi:hypothetical protein